MFTVLQEKLLNHSMESWDNWSDLSIQKLKKEPWDRLNWLKTYFKKHQIESVPVKIKVIREFVKMFQTEEGQVAQSPIKNPSTGVKILEQSYPMGALTLIESLIGASDMLKAIEEAEDLDRLHRQIPSFFLLKDYLASTWSAAEQERYANVVDRWCAAAKKEKSMDSFGFLGAVRTQEWPLALRDPVLKTAFLSTAQDIWSKKVMEDDQELLVNQAVALIDAWQTGLISIKECGDIMEVLSLGLCKCKKTSGLSVDWHDYLRLMAFQEMSEHPAALKWMEKIESDYLSAWGDLFKFFLKNKKSQKWFEVMGWQMDRLKSSIENSRPEDVRQVFKEWANCIENQSWPEFFKDKPEEDLLGWIKWISAAQGNDMVLSLNQVVLLEKWLGPKDELLSLCMMQMFEPWDFQDLQYSGRPEFYENLSFKSMVASDSDTHCEVGGVGNVLPWDEKEAQKQTESQDTRVVSSVGWSNDVALVCFPASQVLEEFLTNCITQEADPPAGGKKWLAFKLKVWEKLKEQTREMGMEEEVEVFETYRAKLMERHLHQAYGVEVQESPSKSRMRL